MRNDPAGQGNHMLNDNDIFEDELREPCDNPQYDYCSDWLKCPRCRTLLHVTKRRNDTYECECGLIYWQRECNGIAFEIVAYEEVHRRITRYRLDGTVIVSEDIEFLEGIEQ